MASSACNTTPGVLHLRLDRPERRNALDGALIDRLLSALRAVAAGGEMRAVLLSGAGPAFCAGADLSWMRDAGRAPWAENLGGAQRLADLLGALDDCPVPTVARVHGAAYGGGAGLVAAVDVAVAASDASFAFSEVKLGLLPAVIAPYVVGKIGESHARALFVTGERFGAPHAAQLGLIHAVVAPDDLDGAVARVLDQLTAAAPGAAGAVRGLVRQVRGRSPADVRDLSATLLARRRASPEGQEGLTAALERRLPRWSLPQPPGTAESNTHSKATRESAASRNPGGNAEFTLGQI